MQILRVRDGAYAGKTGLGRMAAMAASLEPTIGRRIAEARQRGEPIAEVGAVDLVGLTDLVGDEMLGLDSMNSRIASAKAARQAGSSYGPASQQNLGVVEREPTRARDYPIGFDSTTAVAAAASTTISATPQVVFKPQRLIVPASIADNFVFTDIKVGKNSQLAATGNIAAATFVAGAFDVKLNLDTCQIAMSISLSVTNISGAAVRFLATIIGPAVE